MARFREIGGDTYMRAQLWLEAAKSAMEVNCIMDRNDQTLPAVEQQKLFDAYMRHCVLFARGGGNLRPKHHACFHMIWQVRHKGNPRMWATWADESLNGVLAKIARSCHRACWETMVHKKFSMLMEIGLPTYAQAH
jgi:hypothetical protein